MSLTFSSLFCYLGVLDAGCVKWVMRTRAPYFHFQLHFLFTFVPRDETRRYVSVCGWEREERERESMMHHEIDARRLAVHDSTS